MTIQRVGKPGEGMPVGVPESGKRPGHCFPFQTVLHMWVVTDVRVVIGVGERVMADRVVKHNGGKYKQTTESDGPGCWQMEEACAGSRRSLPRGAQTSRSHSSSLGERLYPTRLSRLPTIAMLGRLRERAAQCIRVCDFRPAQLVAPLSAGNSVHPEHGLWQKAGAPKLKSKIPLPVPCSSSLSRSVIRQRQSSR